MKSEKYVQLILSSFFILNENVNFTSEVFPLDHVVNLIEKFIQRLRYYSS